MTNITPASTATIFSSSSGSQKFKVNLNAADVIIRVVFNRVKINFLRSVMKLSCSTNSNRCCSKLNRPPFSLNLGDRNILTILVCWGPGFFTYKLNLSHRITRVNLYELLVYYDANYFYKTGWKNSTF